MGHFFSQLALLIFAWAVTGFVVVGIYRMLCKPRDALVAVCEIANDITKR